MLVNAQPVNEDCLTSGELPVLRHESGAETDIWRMLEHLRKLVSDCSFDPVE